MNTTKLHSGKNQLYNKRSDQRILSDVIRASCHINVVGQFVQIIMNMSCPKQLFDIDIVYVILSFLKISIIILYLTYS